MAKARFHKSQRVFVKPVGTWAHVENVVPKWIRGCDEPIKVLYDCGMGREFAQEELEEETTALQRGAGVLSGKVEWRVVRGQNRWKSAEQCGHHPYPGTHPVLVTTERDWGGWRVPGAEYDLDPFRIEQQAQLMVRAPAFMELLRQFVLHTDAEPENLSYGLTELAQIARRVLNEIEQPSGQAMAKAVANGVGEARAVDQIYAFEEDGFRS
jgi:hypothetical protein